MAEVRGQRKPVSGWLIWLVLLVLAALAVWWLAHTRDLASERDGDVVVAGVPGAPPLAWPATAPG